MKFFIALYASLSFMATAWAVPLDDEDTASQNPDWSRDALTDTVDEYDPQTEAVPANREDTGRAFDAPAEQAPTLSPEKAAVAPVEKAVVDKGEANTPLDREPQIKKALNLGTVGFGPGVPGGLETDKLTYNFYGGKLWEVRAKAMVRANGELITDFHKAVYVAGNIGFGYFLPFSILEFSPYAAGEIGMGLARKSKDNSEFGFNLGAIFGVILFRASDIQLSLEAKAQTLIADFKGGSPAGLSMRIGILF